MQNLTLDDVYHLSLRVLVASGARIDNAEPVAACMRDAEAQGLRNHGLGYLPVFCEHLRCGKVDGNANPSILQRADSVLVVDAANGFAHTAFLFALEEFVAMTRTTGTASLGITRSYSASVVGWFVERLAAHGLVSLAFANASPLMPSWGGKTPRFGTNPLGFGVPRLDTPIVVDMATSTAARVNVVAAARRGEQIPDGWALDREGRPTNDPRAALEGMNAPLGGAKGYGLALMVDVLSAGLTGSRYSHAVSSFGSCEGGPTRCGQLLLAFNPQMLGGVHFSSALESMLGAMLQTPAMRLPGDRRLAARAAHAHHIEVPTELVRLLERYAAQRSPMLRH